MGIVIHRFVCLGYLVTIRKRKKLIKFSDKGIDKTNLFAVYCLSISNITCVVIDLGLYKINIINTQNK